jgi:predicted transcriptional regulator
MTREYLRSNRLVLGLSQSALSRRARVSRWKLNVYEAGGQQLSASELHRVQCALRDTAQQLKERLSEMEIA